MIIFDYECSCGITTERYVDSSKVPSWIKCECGKRATKVFNMRNTTPVDSPWISDVLEVVEKGTRKAHCNEFLKHPTRENYKQWMNKEGLRHLEDGEKKGPNKHDEKTRDAMIKKEILEKDRERNTIAI